MSGHKSSNRADDADGTHSAGTPATRVLERAKAVYRIVGYEHRDGVRDFGAEAAAQLEVDPDSIFKTLVVDTNLGFAVGMVPVSGRLSLKSIAAALGRKHAALADPAAAQRRTGYVVGGISPLGQRTRMPIVLHDGALRFPEILFSGGKRGLDIAMSPSEFLRVSGAITAPIAA